MPSIALTCPHCGAAVAADSPRCQYCQGLLQPVACPKCMGTMFLGSKFCPHCGAAAVGAVDQGTTHHACPRCKAALEKLTITKTEVEQCPTCGGLWMAVAAFDHICSDAESRSAATGLKLPPAPAIDPKVHYLHCPTCATMMGRLNYSGHSGIVLNLCRSHGFWLERDQMGEIVQFIGAGGLDRARQREVEELNQARKSLEIERQLPDIRDLSGLE